MKSMFNVTQGFSSIAFIGNFMPRRCGIATFTTDLLTAVAAETSPETFARTVDRLTAPVRLGLYALIALLLLPLAGWSWRRFRRRRRQHDDTTTP